MSIDNPIYAELAMYKRMFEAACVALGAIAESLGLDPIEGGADPILKAIEELRATQPVREPLTGEQIRDLAFEATGYAIAYHNAIPFTRAIEHTHGIGCGE
jgi:hypothetical protein